MRSVSQLDLGGLTQDLTQDLGGLTQDLGGLTQDLGGLWATLFFAPIFLPPQLDNASYLWILVIISCLKFLLYCKI